jgi:guanylate kinase
MKHHGKLFVLSGPSGVGKDALLKRMRVTGATYHFAITATTRPMRPNERNGVDYVFVTRPRFQEMIDGDDLLEWAEVHGHLYGVPRSQVADALDSGRDVILQVDVQGAATIRKLMPDAVLIFLEPPDMDELERRLSQRMTESPERLRVRLRTAAKEMTEASKFDYRVVNHDGRLDDAVAEVRRTIQTETRRRRPADEPT